MRIKQGGVLAVLVIAAMAAFALVSSSGAATLRPAVRLAPQVKDTGTGGTGQVFLTTNLKIFYAGGTVKLAGSGDGVAKIVTDDVASLTVKHQNGSTSSWTHDFSNSCSGSDTPIAPVDISSLLQTGNNTLSFQESDLCGGGFGGTPYWVTLP
jgi:hypothetical protein